MKRVKMAALAVCGLLLALVFSCASSGGPVAQSSDSSFDWAVNGDADNGGTSTITMTEGTEEGLPAYSFAGNITNDYEYGFVNVKLYPDAPTLEQIKKAKAISFRVQGDGDALAVKITTEDVKDYAYYEYRFDTVDGQPMTIIVPVEHLMQPSWGKAVGSMINLDLAMFVEFQTTRNGSPGPYAFKLWDFRVHTAGIPTEKQLTPKGAAKAKAPAAPKGIGGDLGAMSVKLLDNFQYGDGYQAVVSDKRLFNGHKIAPGESYTLKITYTASRDLEDNVQVGLVDTTPAASYWGPLSWNPDDPDNGMAVIPVSKAGEKVSATIEFKTIKAATASAGVANALVFLTNGEGKKGIAGSGAKKPVTLDFTEFVFTENK
jgi:hypothetical protein